MPQSTTESHKKQREQILEANKTAIYHNQRIQSNKFYKFCYKIIKSYKYNYFIQSCILINTIIQSLDSYPESRYAAQMDYANSFFSIVFIVEMPIKLFGFGFRHYFSDFFNCFDAFIALTSLMDIVVSNMIGQMDLGAVTALRTFRLLRLFKLAKTWKSLNNLLTTMVQTLIDISQFSIILFLFMYVYSLLGMELFAYKAKFDEDDNISDSPDASPIQTNFDSFIWAFTTVFILLTEDNWSYIYYAYYRAYSNWRATLFFQSNYIIGAKILMNIFLAILSENFVLDSNEIESQQIQEEDRINEQLIGTETVAMRSLSRKATKVFEKVEDRFQKVKLVFKNCFKSHRVKNSESPDNDKSEEERKIKTPINIAMRFGYSRNMTKISDLVLSKKIYEKPSELYKRSITSNFVDDIDIEGKSLNLFDEDSKLRKLLFKWVNGTNNYFERLILVFILLSAIQLALTNGKLDPKGGFARGLYWFDFFSIAVFLFESVAKIITFGFIANGAPSYIRNIWNVVDFIVILMCMVAISPLASNLQIFKMFRVLKIVRLISKYEGLKIGLQALIRAIPNVLRIVMILVLFFLLFGIIAISKFKGKFFSCDQNSVKDLEGSNYNKNDFFIDNKWDCYNSGADWVREYYNFDNMYQTMATLFVLSNNAGWYPTMFIGATVTEIDYVWKDGANSYWVFYFFLFMVLGSFFLLNLFTGVVITTFNEQKDKLGGMNNVKEQQQRDWIDIHKIVIDSDPLPKAKQANTFVGKMCQTISDSKGFETFIYASIIANTIVMMMKWPAQSKISIEIVDDLNIFFSALFLVEACIKITANGVLYFQDLWNLFDFTITIASCLTITLDRTEIIQIGGSMMVIRMFRISKILRLIKQTKSLRYIFKTFIHCLRPLINIGSLLILILYMYSVAGVILFGQVKRNGVLTDTLNFEQFSNAALALFVISTTDAWTDIAFSCLKQRSLIFDCIQTPTYADYIENDMQMQGCGPKFSGILYFYSFFLLLSLIMLKLFVAVICEAYEEIKNKESRSFNDDAVENFVKCWQKLDVDANGFICVNKIREFLTSLTKENEVYRDSLFWEKDNLEAQDKFISEMKLKVFYMPKYDDQDILVEQTYQYNYYEILDILSVKLLEFDFANQEIKDRRELVQKANNPENFSPKAGELQSPQESPENKAEEALLSPQEPEQKEDDLDNSEAIKKMEHEELLQEIQIQKDKITSLVEKLLSSPEAQEVLVLHDIQERRFEIQSVIRSKFAQHNQYTSQQVISMEKCVRQMKFYWKDYNPEILVEKENSHELTEDKSQGDVEENLEDDTISEKLDEIEINEREGSEDGSEQEESDEEIKDKDQIEGHIHKVHRMTSLIKFSMQKKVLSKKSQNFGQDDQLMASIKANRTTPQKDQVNQKTLNNLLISSMKVMLETEKVVESFETGSIATRQSPQERSVQSKEKIKRQVSLNDSIKIIMDLNKMSPGKSKGLSPKPNLLLGSLVKKFEKLTAISPKLQLNLNACLSDRSNESGGSKDLHPPVIQTQVEDREAIHSLLLRAYNQTKDQIKLQRRSQFEALEFQFQKPRLRSAISRKNIQNKEGEIVEPTFMVGLGGDDIDFSPKVKRRPLSAFRTTNQYQANATGSPTKNKLMDEKEISPPVQSQTMAIRPESMLQNFFKEDNEGGYQGNTESPLKKKVIDAAAAISNQKVEVKSATFSIGKLSPAGKRPNYSASGEKIDLIQFYSDSPVSVNKLNRQQQ